MYRCKLTDQAGKTTTTESVKAKKIRPVFILNQPEDVSAKIGDTVSFTIEATDVAVYQWGYSTDNGIHWKACEMTGFDTKKLTVDESNVGWLYRCWLRDRAGNVTISDAAVGTFLLS